MDCRVIVALHWVRLSVFNEGIGFRDVCNVTQNEEGGDDKSKDLMCLTDSSKAQTMQTSWPMTQSGLYLCDIGVVLGAGLKKLDAKLVS